MDLSIKNGATIYEVASPEWFTQNTHPVTDEDSNGEVFDLMLEAANGSELEAEYNAWLKQHFNDYYFDIVTDGAIFYAVAYEETRPYYAIEVDVADYDKTHGITTISELVDYINDRSGWPTDVTDIITANGWSDDTSSTFGVCTDCATGDKVVMSGDGMAYIEPAE